MKLIRLVPLALCAAVLLSAAPAQAASPFDSVTGATKRLLLPPQPELFPINVTISAHNGPKGPSGTLTHHNFPFSSGPANFSADVTCLRVVNNTASVGVIIRQSNAPNAVGTQYIYYFSDNKGTPLESQGDAVIPGVPTSDATSCPAPLAPFTRPYLSGNYNVSAGR